MFDNWIGLGSLAEAYELSVDECTNLAQRVPCNFGPLSSNQPYDLGKIEERARGYARRLAEKRDLSTAQVVYRMALSQWYKKGLPAWNEATFRNEWNQGRQEALWPIVRLWFILDLKVDKVQAVHALADCPFRNEVKGLTRAIVGKILASAAPAPQSPAGQESPAADTALADAQFELGLQDSEIKGLRSENKELQSEAAEWKDRCLSIKAQEVVPAKTSTPPKRKALDHQVFVFCHQKFQPGSELG
jgi:hypothetical protein